MNEEQPFRTLLALRALERRHLPFVKSIHDLDLILEIAVHEQRGKPLTLFPLSISGIASPATIYRRLSRLKALGVIRVSASAKDGRCREVRLDPSIRELYESWWRTLAEEPARRQEPQPRSARHMEQAATM